MFNMIYGIVIYVILGILSYFGFKKIINSTTFENVWYSIFWPATWIVVGIGALKDKLFPGKE